MIDKTEDHHGGSPMDQSRLESLHRHLTLAGDRVLIVPGGTTVRGRVFWCNNGQPWLAPAQSAFSATVLAPIEDGA